MPPVVVQGADAMTDDGGRKARGFATESFIRTLTSELQHILSLFVFSPTPSGWSVCFFALDLTHINLGKSSKTQMHRLSVTLRQTGQNRLSCTDCTDWKVFLLFFIFYHSNALHFPLCSHYTAALIPQEVILFSSFFVVFQRIASF